jgi:transposase
MKPDSTSPKRARAKIQALRQSGTLNLRARKVLDRLFLEEDFFDPEDLPQVKYEMLRRVQKETMPIGTAAASFGFSRPSFYKALEDFAREGLVGLIPKKRGPKGGHKLTGEIMAFVDQTRAQEPSVRTSDLVRRIQKQFGTRVHRRTLERALIAAKKNRPNASLADEYGC